MPMREKSVNANAAMDPCRVYRQLPGGSTFYFQRTDSGSGRWLSEVFRLVREAGVHGQGFGAGDWSSEASFRHDVKEACCFAVVDDISGSLAAAILLTISRFYRGEEVAEPYIVVEPEYRGRGLGQLCLKMSIDLAKTLNFIGLYLDVLSNNSPMLSIVSKFCFQQVGQLPFGGRSQHNGRIISSLVYYADLTSMED